MNKITLLLLLVALFFVLMMVRNRQVLQVRLSLTSEEYAYLQERIRRGKKYTGYLRESALPSYDKMLFSIWRPVTYWNRPLSDFYED